MSEDNESERGRAAPRAGNATAYSTSSRGCPRVRLDRIQKRLLEDGLKTILPIRDFVEHVDDRLHVDLEHGQPIMIRITADERGIEVARHTATFSALEAIIGRLHEIASALLEID
jgi:hypothetical protein